MGLSCSPLAHGTSGDTVVAACDWISHERGQRMVVRKKERFRFLGDSYRAERDGLRHGHVTRRRLAFLLGT